jgi:hypothetical protein
MMTREEVEASLWRGKPMRELSRDELLDVIAYLQREHQTARDEAQRFLPHVDFGSLLRDGKR